MAPLLLVLQVADSGFRVDPAWALAGAGGLLSTLTGTIAFLYRGQIAALRERIAWLEHELDKRDTRVDLLIDQVGRAANAAEKGVALAEMERQRQR